MSRTSIAVERLVAIMARLRGPDGCPWDREQTLASLRPYVLEETYEVLEAIDAGDSEAHREELGDLLLQIVFQARLAEEEGRFDLAGVADAISEKLLSRHPHVFGPGATSADARPDPSAEAVRDADGVLRQWAALKKKENEAKGEERARGGPPRAAGPRPGGAAHREGEPDRLRLAGRRRGPGQGGGGALRARRGHCLGRPRPDGGRARGHALRAREPGPEAGNSAGGGAPRHARPLHLPLRARGGGAR